MTADWPAEDAEAYRRLLSWKGLADSRAVTRRLDAVSGAIPEARAEVNRLHAELTRVYYARVPDKDLARHTGAVRDAATPAQWPRPVWREPSALDGASGTGQGRRSAPPHSALIDLSRYIHVQTSRPSEVRYVAFVTRPAVHPTGSSSDRLARSIRPSPLGASLSDRVPFPTRVSWSVGSGSLWSRGLTE